MVRSVVYCSMDTYEAIKNMADHVIKLRDGAVRHNDINTNKVSAEDLEW